MFESLLRRAKPSFFHQQIEKDGRAAIKNELK
jgi:hypothetical protein